MKKLILLFAFLFSVLAATAQHRLRIIVKNGKENSTLAGATIDVPSLGRSGVADSAGSVTFEKIAAGVHRVAVSFVGFMRQEVVANVPQADSAALEIFLEEAEEQEDEVLVTATRISRTIANIPTRVEVISGEELAEKGNMKPGDIRMLLNESTGIQTQQTSATSFNAGIRIQGLEGRYTQLLRDGYPLYAGFAGGLSILQIAPLDLRQVEVIKGSASTLYGGGAIAGLVNLVSKTPGQQQELSFLANATSAGGLDLSGFYSQRYGKVGLTLFASRNSNAAFDPAGIGLTAIPKFQRYTINPRLFFYGKKTTADFGIAYIKEDRIGGSTAYIKNRGAGFFENNSSDRIASQAGIVHQLSEDASLQFKNSYRRFNRSITVPNHQFIALQQSSYSELTWNRKGADASWVFGLNLLTEGLAEKQPAATPKRDYQYTTYGVFVQNAWSISDKLVLESGLRNDYATEYGFAFLPRVSAMVRVTPKLTTRIGGGLGYKTPTIFTEETERIQFQNLLPINVEQSKYERSVGGNWDIDYRTNLGDLGVSVNHLFFYTRLNNPLVLVGAPGGKIQLQNSAGFIATKGTETNLRLLFGEFKLFLGYTYTDANTKFGGTKEWLPLTARHRLNNVVMYEVEEKWKLGLEAYHFSRQRLGNGSAGRPYWIAGFMGERLWKKFSLFLNFENFTDTRQTKFGPIYNGTIDRPVFQDIYAPVEGFVVNGGIKVRL